MRNPDQTFAPTNDRRITDRWELTGPALDPTQGRPAIELTTAHVKDRKAISVRLSYVQIEDNDRWSVLHWQTDWPAVLLEWEACGRYSRKALETVRERALQRLADGDFTRDSAAWLVNRINLTEVAA